MTKQSFKPRAATATLAAHAAALLRTVAGAVPATADAGLVVEIFRREDWLRRQADLETLSADSRDVLKRTLDAMRTAGNWRRAAPAPDPAALLQLTDRHPHMRALIEQLADEAALARCAPHAVFHLANRLLAGEPGCGKTALARDLARVLGVDTIFLPMAGASAGFQIGGLSLGWATAEPGKVHTYLACNARGVANPIVILDELDKCASDGRWNATGPLYSLLEQSTARRFLDEAIGIEIDASRLNIIATANDLGNIESALLSRFSIFEVPVPTATEAAQIARHVYRDMRAGHSWGQYFDPDLSDDVAEVLSEHRPREQTQLLRRAFARAARVERSALLPADIVRDVGADAQQRQPYSTTAAGFIADARSRHSGTKVRA